MTNQNPQSAVTISQKLIKIPSFSGKNDEVIKYMSEFLANLGFECDVLEYDGDNSYPVNNLHAVLNPKNADKILYFAGHTDVVAVGKKESWTYDPFSATIADGNLYGRGAVDMKCAVACFMSAVEEFLAENKDNLNIGLGFLITNDEEADSVNGTKKVLKWMEENNKKITYCIIGEPTNPSVFGEMMKIGRRGSINFSVKIIGRQGHVAYPENAINPTTILINLLKLLKDHKFDNGNKFFGPTNLEITAISSQNLGNNVVPNEAEANFNVRFNDIHSSQSVIELVEYACKKSAEGLGAKYELTHRTSGESFLSEPKILAQTLEQAVEKVCGKTPVMSTSGGTSDARFIKDYAEVVEFGLINTTAHQINEFTSVEDIFKLQKTYLEVLKNFNK
jgi:succinyl-diaminopimelate desuccinylase